MHDERNFKLIGYLSTIGGLVTFVTGLWVRSLLDGTKGISHTFGHSLLFIAVCALAAAISFFVGKKFGAAVYNTIAVTGIVLAVLLLGVIHLMKLNLFGSNLDLVVGGVIFTGICMIAAAVAAFGVVVYQNNEKARQ